MPTDLPDAPIGTRRTTWPAAVPLQQAADTLREVAPDITGRLRGLADPIADLLEEYANNLAWLAPYREHEGGYRMWACAMRVANIINGTESDAAAPALVAVVPPCRCGHDRAQHDLDQCLVCLDGWEQPWQHPYTPEPAAAPARTGDHPDATCGHEPVATCRCGADPVHQMGCDAE